MLEEEGNHSHHEKEERPGPEDPGEGDYSREKFAGFLVPAVAEVVVEMLLE